MDIFFTLIRQNFFAVVTSESLHLFCIIGVEIPDLIAGERVQIILSVKIWVLPEGVLKMDFAAKSLADFARVFDVVCEAKLWVRSKQAFFSCTFQALLSDVVGLQVEKFTPLSNSGLHFVL